MSTLKLTATSGMKNEREFQNAVVIEESISVKTASHLFGVEEDVFRTIIDQNNLQMSDNSRLLYLNQFPKLLNALNGLESLSPALKSQLEKLDSNSKNFTIKLDDGSTATYSD